MPFITFSVFYHILINKGYNQQKLIYGDNLVSIKENVDFIKEELSSEEKFLESSVKAERFYKKHKTKIITLVAVLLLSFIGTKISDYIQLQNKIKANEAYEVLLQKPQDAKAIATLKELNPKLLEIANYQNALKDSNVDQLQKIKNVPFVSSLANYEVAILKKDINLLNENSLDNNSLVKDLASLNQALLLLENNRIKEAKILINSIPTDSNLNQIVKMVQHYMITKK